jgi:hypothetical protein
VSIICVTYYPQERYYVTSTEDTLTYNDVLHIKIIHNHLHIRVQRKAFCIRVHTHIPFRKQKEYYNSRQHKFLNDDVRRVYAIRIKYLFC